MVNKLTLSLTGVGMIAASMIGLACARANVDFASFPDPAKDITTDDPTPRTIVLAGGCFWCTEGVYELIPGVLDVVSGYAGDTAERAKYDLVSSGSTRHAEVIQVTYDPTRISYGQVLKLFFGIAHDPTQLNRQGPDVGTQYRSAIFYADEQQRDVAAAYIQQLDAAKVFGSAIVTTLEPLDAFYPAEAYHQDFVELHPDHPYVRQHAVPKQQKAKKVAATMESAPTTTPTTNPAASR